MVLSLCTVSVQAQGITGHVIRIYPVGASSPSVETDLAASDITCNLADALPPTGEVTNPRELWWDDPTNANRRCRWSDGGTGPLLELPFGAPRYQATLRYRNNVGVGPESNRTDPFARPGTAPTVAPAQVRLGTGSRE